MSNLQISDPRLARAFAGAGRWSRILAIVAFVVLAIFALTLLLAFGTIMGLLSLQPQFSGIASLGAVGVGILFFVYIALFGYIAYLLFRFGTLLRGARDQPISNAAIEKAFKYFTRLMIINVAFIALAVLLAVVLPLIIGSGIR